MYKVFIVDDSKFIITLLEALLKKSGYDVKIFYDAKSAIKALSSELPHLIISDYLMPEMDGFEFCKIVKSYPRTKDIKFILVTGYDDINAKVKCFEIGADDYLLKPFNNDEVLARVKTHITLKSLQDSLKEALNKIDKELEIVGHIQKNLIPIKSPIVEGLSFATYYNTFSKSGGDYFDFIKLDEALYGIVMCDVSGHGTSSTVVMAMLKTIFVKVVNNLIDPSEAINKVNDIILEFLDIDKFATIFYGILDTNTFEMKYTNAGHPFPYMVNKNTSKIDKILGKSGLPVGILPEAKGSYVTNQILLPKKSRIIIYTDGVTELKDSSNDFFGEERFENLILSTIDYDVEKARDLIVDSLLKFSDNKINDDITFIIFDIC